MEKEKFVAKKSIVREIWGKSDTILLIFAGASAEFALNKAVDWLYFTGKLPKDPLGRLFSTVNYAREIVFAERNSAVNAIERMNTIHSSVENNRGKTIPAWAYRDVLFMLIDYSIRSFETLERPLNIAEKEEVFDVFSRLGAHMHLKDLPENYEQYLKMRDSHLEQHLYYGDYTRDLYKQYRKNLGWVRYKLLLESQIMIVPKKVRHYLNLRSFSLISPFIKAFKISRELKLDLILKELILPSHYKENIKNMDRASV